MLQGHGTHFLTGGGLKSDLFEKVSFLVGFEIWYKNSFVAQFEVPGMPNIWNIEPMLTNGEFFSKPIYPIFET